MMPSKYRVFDKKNNFHQSYDGILQGAEGWAKDCAKKIGGYVLEYAHSDFANGKNYSKIYDFCDQGKSK